MTRPLFLPTARETNVLLVVGFLSLGYALYLRYLVIEQPSVALACDAGLQTWLCFARKVATSLFRHTVFGWTAVAAAALTVIRPAMIFFTLALAASAFGIVLYNVPLSALAVALLVVSLARPAVELK